MNPKLSLEEFILLRDFIHEKTGIYLEEKKLESLEGKLQERLVANKLSSYKEYFYFLKYGFKRIEELGAVVDLITIRETRFFRNPPQMKALQEKILPEIVAKKLENKDTTLKIWSAGCATGEEPYTLAMIVLETVLFSDKWQINILANDISHTALTVAREGVYPKERLKDVDEKYVRRYFKELSNQKPATRDQRYEIKPRVKDLVNFHNFNLMWPDVMKKIADMDIILCRNVLIYFSEAAKNKVIRSFYNSLKRGGYYFTGYAETMDLLVSPFKSILLGGAFAYRKE